MNEPREQLLRLWSRFCHDRTSPYLDPHRSPEFRDLLREFQESSVWSELTAKECGYAKRHLHSLVYLMKKTDARRLMALRDGDRDALSSDVAADVTEENVASEIAPRGWGQNWKASSFLRIHSPPGWTLHRIADFCFSKATVESVLSPTLQDLLHEYQEALSKGRIWKARWVRCRGYWSFWSAVVAQLPVSVVKRIYELWRAAG